MSHWCKAAAHVSDEVIAMVQGVRGLHFNEQGEVVAMNGMHLVKTVYGWCVTMLPVESTSMLRTLDVRHTERGANMMVGGAPGGPLVVRPGLAL